MYIFLLLIENKLIQYLSKSAHYTIINNNPNQQSIENLKRFPTSCKKNLLEWSGAGMNLNWIQDFRPIPLYPACNWTESLRVLWNKWELVLLLGYGWDWTEMLSLFWNFVTVIVVWTSLNWVGDVVETPRGIVSRWVHDLHVW